MTPAILSRLPFPMVKAGRIGFPLGCLVIPNQPLDDLDGDFLCKSDPVPVMRQGQKNGAHLNLEQPLLAEPATSCSVFRFGSKMIIHCTETSPYPTDPRKFGNFVFSPGHGTCCFIVRYCVTLSTTNITSSLQFHRSLSVAWCAHVMCLIFTPKVVEEYLVKKRWLHSKRIYIKYPET